jgi:hypothetical protein
MSSNKGELFLDKRRAQDICEYGEVRDTRAGENLLAHPAFGGQT